MTNPVKNTEINYRCVLQTDVEASNNASSGNSIAGGGPGTPVVSGSETGLFPRNFDSQQAESPAGRDEDGNLEAPAIPLSARGSLQIAEGELKQRQQSLAILEKAASKSLKEYSESLSREGHASATGHQVVTSISNSVGIYGTRNLAGYGVSAITDIAAGGPGNLSAAVVAGVGKFVFGIGTAAAGQTVHQNVTTPWINENFDFHYAPVSDGALMTKKKRDSLNLLSITGDYGTRLEAKNKKFRDDSFQKGFHSDFSSKVFATTAAFSAAAQFVTPNTPEGIALKLATIVLASTTAGAVVGGRLARSAAANTVAVPRKRELEALKRKVGIGKATDKDLMALLTREKNVGYPRKMSAADILEKNTKAENERPRTADGMLDSFGNKFMELNRALFPSNVAQAVGAIVSTVIPDPIGQIAVIAIANAGGMGTSVPGIAPAAARMGVNDIEIRAREDGYDVEQERHLANAARVATIPLMPVDGDDGDDPPSTFV